MLARAATTWSGDRADKRGQSWTTADHDYGTNSALAWMRGARELRKPAGNAGDWGSGGGIRTHDARLMKPAQAAPLRCSRSGQTWTPADIRGQTRTRARVGANLRADNCGQPWTRADQGDGTKSAVNRMK